MFFKEDVQIVNYVRLTTDKILSVASKMPECDGFEAFVFNRSTEKLDSEIN